MPWRDELLELSPQTLSIVVLVAFISVVMLKAYAIGIVWRCYKYLTLQRQTLATLLPYLIPDANNGILGGGRMERDYSSLLPDYDQAIAQSLKQAPPPSYSMAMSVNGHVALNDENSAALHQTEDGTAVVAGPAGDRDPSDTLSAPPPYEGSVAPSTTGRVDAPVS